MTDEELNKRVHEIMGLCQCERVIKSLALCKNGMKNRNNHRVTIFNFTGDWETSAYEFGLMFEFMRKHERWEEFLAHTLAFEEIKLHKNNGYYPYWFYYLISPRPFAEAMVRFFEEKR